MKARPRTRWRPRQWPPPGYRLVTADGRVTSYGQLATYQVPPLGSAAVGIASTPDGYGYWLALKGGGVRAAGDAHLYGSVSTAHLISPIVGIVATPNGQGYWLVARDGGVFGFGDAHYYGSAAGTPIGEPIVGMAATPDGRGYLLVSAAGAVVPFGDARSFGSVAAKHLNRPIVGFAVAADGRGYWMVAADGGIFTFGNAAFYGSVVNRHLNQPIVGLAARSPPTLTSAGRCPATSCLPHWTRPLRTGLLARHLLAGRYFPDQPVSARGSTQKTAVCQCPCRLESRA